METNLGLCIQINNLSRWFLQESNYKSSVVFDTDKDSFYVCVEKGNQPLFTQRITQFSQKNKQFLQSELASIVNCSRNIKETN